MPRKLKNPNQSSGPSSSIGYEKMQLKNTKIAPASSASLSTLPGEILSQILQLTMQNEEPIYSWLFPGLNCSADWGKNKNGSAFPPWYPSTFGFDNQKEHFSDWSCVTSTCRPFRDHGIPAFFREKRFVVPCRMLRVLGRANYWDNGKAKVWSDDQGRYLNFIECIHHIIIPSECGPYCDWLCLPRRDLKSLVSVTIWAGDQYKEVAEIELGKNIQAYGDDLKGIDIKVEGVAIPDSQLSRYNRHDALEPTLTRCLSSWEMVAYQNVRLALHS